MVSEKIDPAAFGLCPQHDAPLVKVGGKKVCIAEYMEACLGWQKVVDVILRGKTIYYIFENGHAVPLLCFCCGKPLAVKNIHQERRDIVGRRFQATSARLVTTSDGKSHVEFHLELSKKGWFSKEVVVPLPLRVAARMEHPETCPHKLVGKRPR